MSTPPIGPEVDTTPRPLPVRTRIAGRYMGEEQAEAYGRRNAVPPEMLVRITSTKVVAKVDVAD